MKIVGVYSFNKGKEVVEKNFPNLLSEIKEVVNSIDASAHKNKVSKEKCQNESRDKRSKYLF